jgi:cytochrome c-type biogenesis protein
VIRGASGIAGARPKALLFIVVAVVAASAAAIFLVAPGAADHQGLAALSVPAIVGAGFLDGFNPCAFGVLILFATFALGLAAQQSLATAGQAGATDAGAASRTVLRLGAFFVIGVLATYFLIGLGLLTAVASLTNFGGSHLPSRIAALIAIGLGLWMVRDVLLPDAGWKLEAPHSLHGRMRGWARTSSPVALLCSGAVYLGVVALLGAGGTVGAGLGGLVLYNLAYITPLVALLVLASRPGLIRVVNKWHLQHASGTKAVLATVVLALGFAILVTV